MMYNNRMDEYGAEDNEMWGGPRRPPMPEAERARMRETMRQRQTE